MNYNLYVKLFFASLLFTIPGILQAQQPWQVQGTVYDYLNRLPVDAVTVYSKSGARVITDSTGRYAINVRSGDSIWFSFLTKQTMKYAVDTISNTGAFDIALHIDVHSLPGVKVRSSNYKEDSAQNRKDYAKIFNFRKPSLQLSSSPPSNYTPGSLTVGLDLTELINMFRFRRNKRLVSLQERLVQEEQDKYIYHRFTKRFVRQLTSLDSASLAQFMTHYKPSYEALLQMNEIELGYYIQQCYKQYMRLKQQRIPLKRSYEPLPSSDPLKTILPY